MTDGLNALPPALLAVIGFAAGGALVALGAGLLAEGGRPELEIRAARAPAPADSRASAPPAPEPAPRPSVPAPGLTLPSDPPEPIDGDSLASLVATLRDRDLEVPVADVDPDDLRNDFADPRSGLRTHQALDILAPRGTPVVAVEDGTIASLDPSQGGGGIVVYQFDPTGEFVYYYAHLEEFAAGLTEGRTVQKGDVLGFVGTSGNAPTGTPHLHFAITKTRAPFLRYGGTPINPFEVLR
ncbi:MAG TPA: M23 family metallopeptidase [Gemmatimonadota bacterium]|nr:M23 family metallopeptidase [Gemmatimonadota bacterium]